MSTKNSSTMTARKFFTALFLMGLVLRQSSGFAEISTSFRRFHSSNSHQRTSMSTSTSLSVFAMPDALAVDSPLLLPTIMNSFLLSSMSAICSSTQHLDPNVEAEVFTDMSHVTLDFTPSLLDSSSSKALLKKTSVIGRVFVILADYIPDHSIHPEELVIQLIMLGLAIKNLTSPSMES
jgi:hypothetical protein